MKRAVILTVLTLLSIVSVQADLIWYEGFNYTNGQIIITGTNYTSGLVTNWSRHSGSGNDAFVFNHKLENASSSPGILARQDDVNRKFAITAGSPYTNGQQIIYASFTVRCTNLPNAAGTYFAHYNGDAGNQLCRVYALVGTNLCLPNTWRLGISAAGNLSKIYPVDLALNTDYQVVMSYDPNLNGNLIANLWVNPISSSDTPLSSSDAVSGGSLTNILVSFASRQAGSFGNAFFAFTNVAAATTFDEAATNVWSTNALAPSVVYAPQSRTNFVGDNFNVSAVANGQGLANLIYQWTKENANYANPNGNSNVLSFVGAASTYSGNYRLIVSNVWGLSVTSAPAFIWVTNPPIPPTITTQPASNTVVYPHRSVTLNAVASGPPVLTYQWVYNNGPLGPNATDDGAGNLTITDVQAANGTAGTYRCDVSNPFGTTPSSNAVVSVVFPAVTNIGYLRTLVDQTTFLPTNTTTYWTASGVVTTHTNLTGPPNLSIVMQDASAGIGVFMTGGINAGVFPQTGDNITVTGPLGNFNGALQFSLTSADLSTSIVTNSSNNPLPAPIVLPLTFTNGVGYGGVSNLFSKYVGSLIMLTNVYFTDGPGTYGSGQITETVTNSNGDAFRIFFNAATTPIVTGQPIPAFAWTVTGVLVTFLTPTTVDRSSGFELDPTIYSDIVSAAPLEPTSAIALVSRKPVITWDVQSGYAYSIFSATNVTGPYSPLATGLTFGSAVTAGSFTDTNAAASAMFYKIVSP